MRTEVKAKKSEKAKGELRSPHLVFSNNESLTNPPGLASDYIFFSVKNREGV